ncbi:MAG: DUF1501 domain-containing protein, partial [Chloroflexi bacterium]|nr:DUF1501 domain-containing protein [Chloroflexota bacterium]
LKRGEVIGSSDATGAYPKDRPVTPADLVATLYAAFGIDPNLTVQVPGSEPIRLVDRGAAPIRELLA